MGGVAKVIKKVSPLGLITGGLGDSFKKPDAPETKVQDVANNKVNAADEAQYNEDKKRRAKSAGIQSTILGGMDATSAPTTVKTLLGQ